MRLRGLTRRLSFRLSITFYFTFDGGFARFLILFLI